MSDMPQTQAELEDMLNEAVRKQTGSAVREAIQNSLSKHGAKRLPSVEYNPEAIGVSEDGKWKSKGEFFQKIWEASSGRGIDPRLVETRNLGENFGDAGGFLVPEEFRPDLM